MTEERNQTTNNEKAKAPKIFRILRFVALGLVLTGVTLIILACTVFSTQDRHGDMEPLLGCLFPGVFMIFFSIPCLMISLMPVFHKVSVKTAKYLQETSRDDLEDIATTVAEIGEEATTITARAAATGIKESFGGAKGQAEAYCKYCGASIDADSVFCKKCGRQQ